MMKNDKDTVVTSVAAQRRTRRKRSVIIPAVLSLVLAFALWFYVMSVESPTYTTTFSLVPINVVQGSGTLSVYSSSGSTVDIVVSGKKSVLNQLSSSDFTVTADISGYKTAGKYDVPLSFSVPNGATKLSSSIDSLSLYLDSKTSVQVPVTVKLVDYSLDSGYEIGENDIEKSVDEITVSGPASVLNTIAAAQVTASLGHVTNSKTISSGITLVDAKGNDVTSVYISTDISDVTVHIPIYLTREVPLTVVYKYGYFDSSNVRVTLNPSVVTLRGEVEKVNALDSLVVTTIDETTVREGTITTTIPLPDGVSLVSGQNTAEVNLVFTGIATKTLNVSNITVKNPFGAAYTPSQSSVKVTVRGPAAFVSEMTEDDLEIIVDLSDYTGEQNSLTQNATVKISDEYSSSVFEVGDYTVQLVRE